MRPATHGLLAAALLLSSAYPYAHAEETDKALMERFLREAPAAWKQYEQLAEKLQGADSYTESSTLDGSKVVGSGEMKANSSCRLLRMTRDTEESGKHSYQDEVFVINPRYAFYLRRKNPNVPWRPVEIVPTQGLSASDRISQTFEHCRRATAVLVRMDQDQLGDYLKRPDFRVATCKRVERDGEEFVEVAFSWPNGKGIPQRGSMVLDPKRFWTLRSYDLTLQGGKGRKTKALRFSEVDCSRPYPVARSISLDEEEFTDNKGSVFKGTSTRRGEWAEPPRLPDDKEFTLSAFGLPEPTDAPSPEPPKTWLWVLAAIVIAGSVAGFFYLGKRRRLRMATA